MTMAVKDPDARVDYEFDWGAAYPLGQALETSLWSVVPDEADRVLPGDELVPEPVAIETRGITIDAPPSAVWPWLVQMGYGRAGWYSYDQLDQRGASAQEIVPEWQTLAVGDILPTHPGGGFEVAILEPKRALVVRSDTALVRAQAEAAARSGNGIDTAM